jgi:heptosyltransferase-2
MTETATLVVGPSWVGDMVMAQSLFKRLKAAQPARPIDVLAPAWSLPIVERMPEVRRGIAAGTGHGELAFGKRRRIGAALRGHYDRAIVLPRSLKSALVPWFARIPTRTGFRGEQRYWLINDMRDFDGKRLDQTVKRFVALGPADGEPLDDVPMPALRIDADNQRAVLDRLGLVRAPGTIAFMPGAEYGPAKCWPLEQYAELARLLGERGHPVWVMGSQKDAPAGETIAKASHAINLCGSTSLADVVDLLACADQAVSNDSGLMHVAAATGVHVHAIYGSSSPRFTPPLTTRRDIYWLELDCSPCFERTCPLGHLNCLRQIAPGDVFARIEVASAAGARP